MLINSCHFFFCSEIASLWKRIKWSCICAYLLYGGSFSRFIHVAEVGNRSRSSSVTFSGATLSTQVKPHEVTSAKNGKINYQKKGRRSYLWIQNFGSKYLNPRSGPREQPVTNLENIYHPTQTLACAVYCTLYRLTN